MSEKILSIFIDESGDFGNYQAIAPYYMVAMVLHDQSVDLSSSISALDQKVADLGFPPHAIHTGSIIRKEFRSMTSRQLRISKMLSRIFSAEPSRK